MNINMYKAIKDIKKKEEKEEKEEFECMMEKKKIVFDSMSIYLT